ncbi:MAG: DUF4912 domain-containing protein [Treponema sp.]|nr:DUF4912 domain-containing protein [Treponema sp.]
MEDNLQVPVSRHWLESLSTDELIKLADTYGIDIPPGLERIFIIEELLEAANTDRQETTDDIEVNPSYSETALLPKQYNISFIEIIIRDPLWIYAFWEIKGHDREIHENAGDFDGYCLRVIPINNGEPDAGENSFTVSLDPADNARYLGFAEHSSQASGCYVIKLCVKRGDNIQQIASSRPFSLPKLNENDVVAELGKNPLMRLSGVQDLQITKNTDRQSRARRQ